METLESFVGFHFSASPRPLSLFQLSSFVFIPKMLSLFQALDLGCEKELERKERRRTIYRIILFFWEV